MTDVLLGCPEINLVTKSGLPVASPHRGVVFGTTAARLGGGRCSLLGGDDSDLTGVRTLVGLDLPTAKVVE